MSQEDWGLQPPPPDSGKTIIFRAKAQFFGQKPAAKNGKNIFCFVFIKQKKRNSLHLVRLSARNPGFLLGGVSRTK